MISTFPFFNKTESLIYSKEINIIQNEQQKFLFINDKFEAKYQIFKEFVDEFFEVLIKGPKYTFISMDDYLKLMEVTDQGEKVFIDLKNQKIHLIQLQTELDQLSNSKYKRQIKKQFDTFFSQTFTDMIPRHFRTTSMKITIEQNEVLYLPKIELLIINNEHFFPVVPDGCSLVPNEHDSHLKQKTLVFLPVPSFEMSQQIVELANFVLWKPMEMGITTLDLKCTCKKPAKFIGVRLYNS
jgi:hypothetical protein